jgi:CRISPR-associated protein Cas2
MSIDSEYVAAYDISDDRERTRVEKTLKGFGFRIQKSVFECRMKKGDREQLLAKLDRLNIKTGFVKLYRLDPQSKQIDVGELRPEKVDADAAYVVA